jgi:hypothetical protein
MSDPAAPTPAAATVDHLKQLLAVIEELPQLVADVTAIYADLHTLNIPDLVVKAQAAIADLKKALGK